MLLLCQVIQILNEYKYGWIQVGKLILVLQM